MDIKNIFPLTEIRAEILSEILQEELSLKELALKLNKSPQLIFNRLQSLNEFVNKKNNVYSLKDEFNAVVMQFLIRYLLEKRLGKYFAILPFVKKYYKPSEMIVFGSFIRNEQREDSDIDIYVISEISDKDNVNFRTQLSNLFKKEVQIISVNPKIHLTKEDKYSDLYQEISGSLIKGIKVNLDSL